MQKKIIILECIHWVFQTVILIIIGEIKKITPDIHSRITSCNYRIYILAYIHAYNYHLLVICLLQTRALRLWMRSNIVRLYLYRFGPIRWWVLALSAIYRIFTCLHVLDFVQIQRYSTFWHPHLLVFLSRLLTFQCVFCKLYLILMLSHIQ